MRIGGVLLAAGRSTRFGPADKLAVTLHGRPLIAHAADAMRAVPLDRRFVVRASGERLAGFETVTVAPGLPMSRSLAAGIVAAEEVGAEGVLVLLADMPFVTPEQLAALIDASKGPETLLASEDSGQRSPPALFGQSWFGDLARSSGDAGARALIGRAQVIAAPPGSLQDVDTPEDLERLGRPD